MSAFLPHLLRENESDSKNTVSLEIIHHKVFSFRSEIETGIATQTKSVTKDKRKNRELKFPRLGMFNLTTIYESAETVNSGNNHHHWSSNPNMVRLVKSRNRFSFEIT